MKGEFTMAYKECEKCKYCIWTENRCSTDREDQVWLEPNCSLEDCKFEEECKNG